MSNNMNITHIKNFDVEQVSYKEPKVNSRGGKAVQVLYKGRPFCLQFPLTLNWGLNVNEDTDTGRVKYDVALQFEPGKSNSQEVFLNKMKEFEEKIKNDIVANSKKWLGKNQSKEVVEALMYPVLKYRKQKDKNGQSTGEPDYDSNPTLKLKVWCFDGRFIVELYDYEKNQLYKPAKRDKPARNCAEGQEEHTTPEDFITKGSHMSGLMVCTGLWFSGGKCGVTFKLEQAKVKSPQRLVGNGTCHMLDDDDDVEVLQQLKEKEEKEREEQESGYAGVEDDDEEEPVKDDEEEEEQEEVVEAPKVVKKKKKVLKKKKIVKKM